MLLSPLYTPSSRFTLHDSIPGLGTIRTIRPQRTQPPYVFVFQPADELSGDHDEYFSVKSGRRTGRGRLSSPKFGDVRRTEAY